MSGGAEVLEQARRALARQDWADAHEALSAAAEHGALACDDWERLARAAHLAGHDEDSADAWLRAHRCHLDRGEPRGAARCAFWLGFGLLQRGEAVRAGGWLGRSRRIVDEQGLDCVEHGYLLVPEAVMAVHAGDATTAHERFAEAGAVARRFADRDLAALATLGRGQALLRLDRVADGVRLFDEAMVSVTAGEVSPTVSGIVYCAVVFECQRIFDLRRAQEWTVALDRWCEGQPGLVPYRGQCLVHRSQVLQWHGAWLDALTEARRAHDLLAEPPRPALGMACYQLGDLYRLRGRLVEAEDAYRRAHEAGHPPQPGLALLRLAQGRTGAAAGGIERALGEAHDVFDRAQLLPACVEIMLACGRWPDARHAADELAELAARLDAGALRAAAAHAHGAVVLAGGEPAAALDALRDACQAWQALDAPYEAARVRVDLALAYRGVGDHDAASLECGAARAALQELGAAPALARLDGLWGTPRRARTGPRVTRREREVLRLVAAGRTNREIAATLVISEKTVERHLSNIFTKIGVSNRAAATAYAYAHDLL